MGHLTLHPDDSSTGFSGPIVIVGEVLWDVFPDSVSLLGGAPLNFSAHARRLGLHPILISALGCDDLGHRAAAEIQAAGLDMSLIGRSPKWTTGRALVTMDANGQPHFQIPRPAAYDDLKLSDDDLSELQKMQPSWIYYGTVYASLAEGRATLKRLLEALPHATRFYDVNLRPGGDRLDLVGELLAAAQVVKLNESEAERVIKYLDLPESLEAFCRQASARFGWRAVCVTLGENVVVELRPGAGGNIGAEYVAKSARADGYTILLASLSLATNVSLMKLNFDPRKDLGPIGGIVTFPNVLVVSSRDAARTVQDIVTRAREQPGKLTFGAIWIRYRRDCRRHPRTQSNLWTVCRDARRHRIDGAVGHGCGLITRQRPKRSVWPKGVSFRSRTALHCFSPGLRLGLELVRTYILPLDRRTRHRRIVRSGTDVHR